MIPESARALSDRLAVLLASLATAHEDRLAILGVADADRATKNWSYLHGLRTRFNEHRRVAAENQSEIRLTEFESLMIDLVIEANSFVNRELSEKSLAGEHLRTELDALWLELTRAQHVTVPRVIADAMTLVRAGHLADGEKPVLAKLNGETFTTVLYDARYWNLKPSRGQTLTLPLERSVRVTEQNVGTHTRRLLTPGVLRAWLATWVLAANRSAQYGIFTWDIRKVLLDLYQAQPVFTTVRGKRYARPSPTLERDIEDHFKTLHSIYLHGLGNIKPEPPQQLITTYQDTNERERVVYQHAPLAWLAVRKSFTQVPLAVLRLDANDVPLALGLANVWRAHATSTLRGPGHYTTSLCDLATEAGEDHVTGSRNYGMSYWIRLLVRLSRTLHDGNLGTLHVSGEGPDAIVTLTPSSTLAAVYQPLVDASDKQQEFVEEARFDAAVRSLLDAPRRRGRPRKVR